MIRFVDAKRALAIHDPQIAEHGGAPGIRDMALLKSALARPININDCAATEDQSRVGAAYLFGISKNHPFVDGNKRTALGVVGLFLKTAIDGVRGMAGRFAQAFVEPMTTPGPRVDDAFRALREEVSRKTDGKQEPEILRDDLKKGALALVKSP